ncbi:MAG: GNAT family protein [Bacteroides sp.]|nr:GNAT family N-acetyltransferase [Bacteroides sp.]MDD2646215.1 GNAT family protein [Bacteroides sp.]MDD4055215.1 GNAT family protein [Bacteroides sp.]MDD4720973.1 GNAT family protein [Bacteroides sp.]NLI64170.1 GNAT family N-acetyltransferase [Bacteroidales bacterium]
MNKQFLANENLYLRAVEPEDLSFLYNIENDPNLWDVSNITVPYSKFVLRQYIEASQSDIFSDRQLRLMIVRREDNELLGTLDITEFHPLHGRGQVGIAIKKEFRQQGYASQALKLLCDYTFQFLQFRQLYAYIAANNGPSIQLFKSLGFKKAALLKDWLMIEGEYQDTYIYQLINKDQLSND